MQKELSFLLKDAGKLSFFENESILIYDIDLRTYYKNAELLHNTTIEMSKTCDDLDNKRNCEFFVQNYQDSLEKVRNNANWMKLETNRNRSFEEFETSNNTVVTF